MSKASLFTLPSMGLAVALTPFHKSRFGHYFCGQMVPKKFSLWERRREGFPACPRRKQVTFFRGRCLGPTMMRADLTHILLLPRLRRRSDSRLYLSETMHRDGTNPSSPERPSPPRSIARPGLVDSPAPTARFHHRQLEGGERPAES